MNEQDLKDEIERLREIGYERFDEIDRLRDRLEEEKDITERTERERDQAIEFMMTWIGLMDVFNRQRSEYPDLDKYLEARNQ